MKRKKSIVISGNAVAVIDPSESVSVKDAVVRLPAPVIGQVPAVVAHLGVKGKKRFTSFFTDNIRNKNTREAYFRATFKFFEWCQSLGLEISDVESFHVSTYVELPS